MSKTKKQKDDELILPALIIKDLATLLFKGLKKPVIRKRKSNKKKLFRIYVLKKGLQMPIPCKREVYVAFNTRVLNKLAADD